MSNASNLSTLANVLDDGSDGQFLKSTGSGGVAFDTVAAGATVYSSASDLPLTGNTVGDMAYVSAATTAKVVNQATGSVSTEDATRLYIYSGTGWYSVAFITQNPTISTVQDAGSNTTPFTLATDGTTATVVTITANDPESVPLTYSYNVTDGSLNGCTITGADGTSARVAGTAYTDNVFTVTPHASNEATFTITFTASDGINQATSANVFSLSFITTVTDSKYTTLLATATNGTSEFYSLSGALYDSITLDTSSESTGYQTFAFNNDGTKLFRISSTIIYQYTLTTGFDLSTGSYDNVSYTIPSNQGSAARAIQFNNDGTKMYVYTSSNTRISQYALTNGFDLSDVSYDNKLYNGTTGNSGFTFNNDGTKLFKATATSKTIETYNLNTAFDISTASDANVSFSTASQTSNTAFQVQFNSNGTKMFVMDWVNSAGNNIYQYTLTQPYVVSSATYDNVSYNYNSQESSPSDFKFNNNGTKMYIGGFATDRIHQYSTVLHGNSNITDSSSSSHSITVNGDSTAGTFSPYRSGGYATSFSRSASSKLEIASMPAIGSGDCSIECWINIESSLVEQGIILRGVYNSVGGFALTTRASGGELMLLWSGSINVTSGANIVADKWHWIQVIRSSGTVTIYVNGSSVGSWSNSSNVSSTSNYIIGRADSYFGGQIRDLRISTNAQSSSSGSEKLETDSNTTFLSCHLPYLSYATSSVASNSYSSNSGTIKTVPFSPYDYTEYSAADHGGSVYFDGTGDYLTAASDASFDFGTGNFTIETWINIPDVTSTWSAIISRAYSATGGWRLYKSTGNSNLRFYYTGNSYINATSTGLTNNTWHHIAVVRNSGTITIYVDGASKGSGSDGSTSLNPGTYAVEIGSGVYQSSYPMTGYLGDLRIVNGTAVYTGGFTPPSGPLTTTGGTYSITTNVNTSIPSSNTKLHIKSTDASIIDKSQGANIQLYGSVTGNSSNVPSGSSFTGTNSIYLDGDGDGSGPSGDHIRLPMETFDPKNRPYTVEFWFKIPSSISNTSDATLFCNWHWSAGRRQILLTTKGSTKQIKGYYSSSGSDYSSLDTANNVWSYDTWHHFAMVYDPTNGSNGTRTIYIDGSSVSTNTSYTSLHTPDPDYDFVIGSLNAHSGSPWEGYIYDFRIQYKCLYPNNNFTPPTAPLEG